MSTRGLGQSQGADTADKVSYILANKYTLDAETEFSSRRKQRMPDYLDGQGLKIIY